MSDYKDAERATKVGKFLESPEWEEAWDTYRDMLLEAMQNPKFSALDVEHQRHLLWAAKAAKAHLERLVSMGKVAQASIELEAQKQTFAERIKRRWAA